MNDPLELPCAGVFDFFFLTWLLVEKELRDSARRNRRRSAEKREDEVSEIIVSALHHSLSHGTIPEA